MKTLLLSFALIAAIGTSCSFATNYYVSPSGSDGNSGTSTSSPWQTIAKVNGSSFSPGDGIFFQGGQTFSGNLTIKNSGNASSRITLSSYGTGVATISAATDDGIILTGASYVTVTYINVSGPGWNQGTLTDGSRGIFLTASSDDCIVDHVVASGFHSEGVRNDATTSNNQITYVTAQYNGDMGISVEGNNQLVSDCYADDNYGDLDRPDGWSGSGILADTCTNVTIQYCEASGNGSQQPFNGEGPAGIWCSTGDNTIITHCISHNNFRGNASTDGDGFDMDGGCTNCTIEYCYSYGNVGAGFLFYDYAGASSSNNTYRYCISENDATLGLGGITFGTSGNPLTNEFAYNNVIFNTAGGSVIDSLGGGYSNCSLYNNIFISSNTLSITSGGLTLKGNCYYSSANGYSFDSYGSNFTGWANGTGQEEISGKIVGLNVNPILNSIGNGTKLTNPRLLSTLTSYSPSSNSPVVNAGLNLNTLYGINPGTIDFVGNPNEVGSAYDMGAFEYQGSSGQGSPVILDVSGTTGIIVTGSWTESTYTSGYYGSYYLEDDDAGGGKSVRFTPNLPAAGYYQVSAWWTAGSNRATNVPIDIICASGTAPVEVSEQTDGEEWVSLGIYFFNAGTGGSVILSDSGANDYVIADAVEFTPVTPVILDVSGTTGITVTGSWTESTYTPGYYGSYYLEDDDSGGGKSVKFTPNLPVTGTYEVYAWWTAGSNRATNVPVTIVSGTRTAPLEVNEQTDGEQWVPLGTYSFNAGTGGSVTISDTGANDFVITDAVEFVPQ